MATTHITPKFHPGDIVLDVDGLVGRVVSVDGDDIVVSKDAGFGDERFMHGASDLTLASDVIYCDGSCV